VATEPDAIAAPVCIAARRQHEEEFLRVEAGHRAVDHQLRAGVGDVADLAGALPGSVDRHDPGGVSASELNAVITAAIAGHRPGSPVRTVLSSRGMVNGTRQQGITGACETVTNAHADGPIIPAAARFPCTRPRGLQALGVRASAADSSTPAAGAAG